MKPSNAPSEDRVHNQGLSCRSLSLPFIIGIVYLGGTMLGSAQTTRYVSLDGTGEAPYTSLATAATTIQVAVDVADPGDTILVAAGIYDQGGRVAPEQGAFNRVCITKPLTLESISGAQVTEIRGLGPKGSDAVRCLFVTDGATVKGFTLSGGSTDTRSVQYTTDEYGGGVMCYYGGHVIDCIITDCTADRGGGGVYCINGGQLDNCTITRNSVKLGTGLAEGGGVNILYSGTLNDCIISFNTNSVTAYSSEPYGGGVFMAYGGELNRCIIRDNRSIGDYDNPKGGGVCIETSGKLNNCLIINNKAEANHATAYGGGVFFYKGGSVISCTITKNEAGRGGGVYKSSSQGSCLSSIVYGNSAGTNPNNDNGVSMYYSCSTPLPYGFENTDVAPAFTNAVGDYRLTATSPCIDTGDPMILSGVGQDGVPRPLDSDADGNACIDMGAYEFVSLTADSDGDGITDGVEINTFGSNPASANSDGDEMSDMEEFIASTDPMNPDDYFKVEYAKNSSASSTMALEWPSFTGRYYNVYWSTNLTTGFTNLITNLEHPVNSYTDTLHSAEQGGYYRIDVRLKP